MKWISLDSENQLAELVQLSYQKPQFIFKHSTRCGVSSMAMNRLERNDIGADFYLVDVIGNRSLSNKIAEQFDIYHESPQLLLISEGQCVFNDSHFNISSSVAEEAIKLA